MASTEEKIIKVFVDMRETNSGNIQRLQAMPNLEVKVGELSSGDYAIHETTCIERKSAADFVASIMDGRLFSQIARMKNEYQSPVILIEGDVFKVRSQIKEEAIVGAMSYCTAVEKVNLITVLDDSKVPLIIATMARHLQHGLSQEPSLHGTKPKPSVHSAQYQVEILPGVGPKRARDLLFKFRSPIKVFNAAPGDIATIKGIGMASAMRMHESLHYEVPHDFDPSKMPTPPVK